MILTLEVLEVIDSHDERIPEGVGRKVFEARGGTIGRHADNAWVLPAASVSGHHARIACQDGVFSIEDTSTNGVFINSVELRVGSGRSHPLASGDHIIIGPYKIGVSITSLAVSDHDPFAALSDVSRSPIPPDSPEDLLSAHGARLGEEVDPLKALNLDSGPPPDRERPSVDDLKLGSPLDHHYIPPTAKGPPTPPAPPSEGGWIPDNYDPLADDSGDGHVAAPPVPEPPPPAPPPVEALPPPPVEAPLPPLSEVPPEPAPSAPPVEAQSPPPSEVPPEPSPSAPPVEAPLPPLSEVPPEPAPSAPPVEAQSPSPSEIPPRPAPSAPSVEAPLPPLSEVPPEPAPSAPAVEAQSPPPSEVPPEPAPSAPPVEAQSPPPSEVPLEPAPSQKSNARPETGDGASVQTGPTPDTPKGGASDDLGLAAVLAGAGLENVEVTPELARSFGRILRVVVTGVMEVLRARQDVKDEFNMLQTRLMPIANNPLKFSVDADDALHNLLVKRNKAYLEPVEAFEDAFDDLRSHQMAELEGMQSAFQLMLADFHPDRLEKEFDRQLRASLPLRVLSRFRYWGLYRDWVQEMAEDREKTFRTLFGERFAQAYEEQLGRLKQQRREQKAEKSPGHTRRGPRGH